MDSPHRQRQRCLLQMQQRPLQRAARLQSRHATLLFGIAGRVRTGAAGMLKSRLKQRLVCCVASWKQLKTHQLATPRSDASCRRKRRRVR